MSLDLRHSWPVMAVCVLLAFLVGFLFILSLKHKAALVVWLFIVAFFIMLCSCAIISALDYANSSTPRHNPWSLFFALFFGGLAALLAMLTVCQLRRIRLVIAIMKTCSIFIADNLCSLLLPLANLVVTVIVLGLWVWSSIHLYSLGWHQHSPHSLPFAAFHHSYGTGFMGFFHLIGLLWLLLALVGCL